jgi:hypothetical protein
MENDLSGMLEKSQERESKESFLVAQNLEKHCQIE